MDDLYIIKKNNTGTNKTEMHILSADSKYQEFRLQTRTALKVTDDSFDFVVTPHIEGKITFHGDDLTGLTKDYDLGNLIVIYKTFGTICTLYILTGSHFQKWGNSYWAGSYVTQLPAIYNNDYWGFAMDIGFNLVAIKKNTLQYPTGSGFTELHVLTQQSGYEEIVHIVTALRFSDGNFVFQLAPNSDLFIIQKNGVRSTEVHVLSAASQYQEFILEQETPIGITDDTWDFVIDSNRNLVAIDKGSPTDPARRTGTGSTEIHILSADSNYQDFIFESGTPLEMTGSNFKFCMSLDQFIERDIPE